MSDRVQRALAEALERGEVSAVVMHRETDVPAVVAEAVVEEGLPVLLAGEDGEERG